MNRDIKVQVQGEEQSSGDAAVQAPVQLNPLLINLSSEKQQELVAIIMEDFRNASLAREEKNWGRSREKEGLNFDEKFASLIDLYEGADESRPEKWMCARSLKIAQAIIEMAVARLVPMIVNEDIINWKEVRTTNKMFTARVNRMMFWVLYVWIKVRHDALMYIRNAAMLGNVFAEAYWSVKKKDTGRKETIPVVDEMGQQISAIEQTMFTTEQRPAIRIIPLTRVFLQPGAKNLDDDPVIVLEDFQYHELEGMQREGLAQNVTDALKNEVDTRISSEFRLSLEKAEDIADFNAKRRSSRIECIRWYGTFDANGDGFDEEIVALVSRKEEVYLRAYPLSVISRKNKRTLRHRAWIDRIGDKFYGIGLLEQVKPLAEEIDACFRQMTDANTLSVLRWGFYDPNSEYDPDEHVAKPRTMYPVTNPTQNVYFPDMTIPTERLLNAIRLVLEFIERLTAASSYVMGKESEIAGGSGTATRTQAIVSAADTRFNLPAQNLREGLAELFTDIFDLCCEHIPAQLPGLQEKILGTDGEPVFPTEEDMLNALALEMDCYLIPPTDLGDANTRRQLANVLYDKLIGGMNPLVVNDVNRIWFGTANLLRAYGEDPLEWIGRPASKKPTNDPELENIMIRDGRPVPVEPQENHLEHIMIHSDAVKGPNIMLWPEARRVYLQQHIQQHQQMMQMILMQQQQTPQRGGMSNGEDAAAPQPGADAATAGGAALAGGAPDVSVAPNQATGTPQQQADGAALGGNNGKS